MSQPSLSDRQKEIIKNHASRLLVEAQPGSGKTRVLVNRFVSFIQNREISPDRIVAITFTEKAAQEMRQRVVDALDQKYSEDQFWISTIHAFCYRILSERAWEADLSPDFSILTAEEALFLRDRFIRDQLKILQQKGDAPVSYLLRAYGFSSLKALVKECFNKRDLLNTMREKYPPDPLSKESWDHLRNVFDRLLSAYDAEKQSAGVCDFDDLLLKCRNLFKKHPEVAFHYRKRFKAIFVDEFQDTDALQKEILDSLVGSRQQGPKPALMIVGDPKQSIYRFRGADVQIFEDTKADVLSGEGFYCKLTENYRSQKPLIDFVNLLFEPLLSSYFEPAAAAPDQERVARAGVEYWRQEETLTASQGRLKEARWLADAVQKFKKAPSQKARWSHIAVLFRAMTYAHLYEKALDEAGVPWVRSDGGFFYQSREVEQLLFLLKGLLNPKDEFSLWVALWAPWFGLTPKILWRMAWVRSQHKSSWIESFERAETLLDLTPLEKKRVRKALAHLKRLAWLKNRVSLTEWYLKAVGYGWGEKENKFIQCVMRYEAKHAEDSWEAFIEYMETLRKAAVKASEPITEATEDGVRLLTVHQSKGLEFDVVFIPDLSYMPKAGYPDILIDRNLGIGLKEDTIYQNIQQKERLAEREESKRLFFVALTRAKHHLVLSDHAIKPRKDSWAFYVNTNLMMSADILSQKVFS